MAQSLKGSIDRWRSPCAAVPTLPHPHAHTQGPQTHMMPLVHMAFSSMSRLACTMNWFRCAVSSCPCPGPCAPPPPAAAPCHACMASHSV